MKSSSDTSQVANDTSEKCTKDKSKVIASNKSDDSSASSTKDDKKNLKTKSKERLINKSSSFFKPKMRKKQSKQNFNNNELKIDSGTDASLTKNNDANIKKVTHDTDIKKYNYTDDIPSSSAQRTQNNVNLTATNISQQQQQQTYPNVVTCTNPRKIAKTNTTPCQNNITFIYESNGTLLSSNSSIFFDPSEDTQKSPCSFQNADVKATTTTSRDSFQSAIGIPHFEYINKGNVRVERKNFENKISNQKEIGKQSTPYNRDPVIVTLYDTDEYDFSSDIIESSEAHSTQNIDHNFNIFNKCPLSNCGLLCPLERVVITKEIIDDSGEVNKCKFCVETPFLQTQERDAAVVEIISNTSDDYRYESQHSSDEAVLLISEEEHIIQISSPSIPILVGNHQTNYSSISSTEEEFRLHNVNADIDQSQCLHEDENIFQKTSNWFHNSITDRDILAFMLGAVLFLGFVIIAKKL